MMKSLLANKESMYKHGISHARAGLMLTKVECKTIDDFIAAHVKGKKEEDRVQIQKELRGAFNEGWQAMRAGQIAAQ